jgi:hypothetical protein
MACEFETAGCAIHFEDSDVIGSLIATSQEPPRRVEAEAAWVIPSCPFLFQKSQVALGTNSKNPNAVVQPIPCINKFAIAGNQDLRTEIATSKTWRESRDRLARC